MFFSSHCRTSLQFYPRPCPWVIVWYKHLDCTLFYSNFKFIKERPSNLLTAVLSITEKWISFITGPEGLFPQMKQKQAQSQKEEALGPLSHSYMSRSPVAHCLFGTLQSNAWFIYLAGNLSILKAIPVSTKYPSSFEITFKYVSAGQEIYSSRLHRPRFSDHTLACVRRHSDVVGNSKTCQCGNCFCVVVFVCV